jgi:hypothetical protein
MEDQGAAWMAKELRARDSFHGGATMARELWLAGSYEAVALARGPDEADDVAAGSLELNNDP